MTAEQTSGERRYTELLPPLSADEYEALKADIAERGCLVPVEIDEDGNVLDGAHRQRACAEVGIEPPTITRRGLSDAEKRAHAIALNLQRRQLSREQRRSFHVELRNLGKSLREIAAASGVDPATVMRDTAGVESATPARTTGRDGKSYPARQPKPAPVLDFPGAQTARQAKRQEGRAGRQEAKAAKRAASIPTSNWTLIHSAICDLTLDEPADAIITDPPYPREYLPAWAELAAFAARSLKPGGSLLAMSGQSYLPEIYATLAAQDGLTYRWTLAYLTPGGQAVQLWDRQVNTFWKPILWFVADGHEGEWVGDVVRSDVNDNDKFFHRWGQSESGMADLIDRTTKPGDLICDPFLGGGTTGYVAAGMGRRFIGADIDPDCVEQSERRLAA